VAFAPPLIVTEEDMKAMVDILAASVREVLKTM
jgi:adenosylmethionine-8-amino-7-oxononanoate aminotransferase